MPSMAPPAPPDAIPPGDRDRAWLKDYLDGDPWWFARQIETIHWDRFAILLLICACAWRPWAEMLPNQFRRLSRRRRRPHVAATEHPAVRGHHNVLLQIPTSATTVPACGSFLTLKASGDQPLLVTALRKLNVKREAPHCKIRPGAQLVRGGF